MKIAISMGMLVVSAGVASAQVTPGAFAPGAVEDYEALPAGVNLPSIFGGTVAVTPLVNPHRAIVAGGWSDFRGVGNPSVVPVSGSQFGVIFGFTGIQLDFTGVGGTLGFSGFATAAGTGIDTISFFDMAGVPMTGTYTDADGFGPMDGTMERFSFVSSVPIGFIVLSGPETAYDNLAMTAPTPGAAALLGLAGLVTGRRRR